MKITQNILLGCLLLSATPSFAFCDKGDVFSATPSADETSWRSTESHQFNNDFFDTSSLREKEIARVKTAMSNEVLGIGMPGDTPPIEFISADGVKEAYLSHSDGANHQMTVITVGNVTKTATGGSLEGTLLVPASGHTGAAAAKVYAKKDTYTVHYEISLDAEGQKFPSYDGSSGPTLAKDAKSLGLVTAHEMSIPLEKGHVTRIYYFRSGSGGPGGYFDGRVIDFVWDGTTK